MRATTVVALTLSAAVPALSAPLLPLHILGPIRMGPGPVMISKPIQARELTDLLARDVQAGSGAFGWGSLIKDGAEIFGDLFGGSSSNNNNNNNNNRREIEELLAREPLSFKPKFWIDHDPLLAQSQIRTRELDELLARDVQAGSGAFGWGSLIEDGAEIFGDLFGGNSNSNNNNKREVEELLARNLYIDGRTIYTGPGLVRVNWADLPKRELEELLARDVQDGSGAFGWGSIIKDGAEIFGDLFGSSSSNNNNQNNRREEVIGQLLARQAQSQQGSGAFGWGSIIKDGAEIFGDLFGGSSSNNNQNNRRELIELLTREVEAQQGSGAFGWGTIIKDGAEIFGDLFDGSSNNNNNNNN